MRERSYVHQHIQQSIAFIQRAQLQAEEIRQQLNHEIMFNLRDTYLSISRQQTALSLNYLSLFLGINDSHAALQKMVTWNNHGNSLNLSFAQFSAMLVTKEDRLLAKMVLEREEMGAIPNFLLEKVKSILMKQMEIHQFCMGCDMSNEVELREWVQGVIDQNGDICQSAIDSFMNQADISSSSSRSSVSSSPFMRYLQTSGNITGQRLLLLWKTPPQGPTLIHDSSSKMHKLSTYISISPKSLTACHSQQQLLRPQYFDCLNRPLVSDFGEVRESKSIDKHIFRMSSDKNLKIIAKGKSNNAIQSIKTFNLLAMLKEIMEAQRQTENTRIQLRLCPDFYPILFYQSIPKDRTKTITATNFRDYLQSFGYYVQPSQIYLLFRRYSTSSKLSFNTFCLLFDTIQREFDLLEKNRYVQSLQDMELSTKKMFFSLILAIVKNQIRVNQIKNAFLRQCKDLQQTIDRLYQSFGTVRNQLTEHQLKQAFRKLLKINVPISDIRLILRRCGQNKPNGDPLSKATFMKQVLPNVSIIRK